MYAIGALSLAGAAISLVLQLSLKTGGLYRWDLCWIAAGWRVSVASVFDWRTCMAGISTMRSGPSVERSRNRPRTEPKIRLHQNYTEAPEAGLSQSLPIG